MGCPLLRAALAAILAVAPWHPPRRSPRRAWREGATWALAPLATRFNPKGAERQPYYLPKLVKWYSPAEVLKMATADNAELLALSGPRNPYPGKLGVVEEGALADLLLVDGDPIANIKLLETPARNLLVVMKDGKVYKNALPR